jgi:tetratricopeptide (TPR) repeat protein
MCYISKAYRDLKWYDEAVLWGEKAIKTYPHLRDGYLAKLMANYYKGEYEEAIKTGKKALRITDYDEQMYSDAACWDGTIYDFLSLSFYKLKDYSNAVKMVNKALKQNPTLKRLQVNKQLFVDLLENNKH